jgi:hypothetical protein
MSQLSATATRCQRRCLPPVHTSWRNTHAAGQQLLLVQPATHTCVHMSQWPAPAAVFASAPPPSPPLHINHRPTSTLQQQRINNELTQALDVVLLAFVLNLRAARAAKALRAPPQTFFLPAAWRFLHYYGSSKRWQGQIGRSDRHARRRRCGGNVRGHGPETEFTARNL